MVFSTAQIKIKTDLDNDNAIDHRYSLADRSMSLAEIRRTTPAETSSEEDESQGVELRRDHAVDTSEENGHLRNITSQIPSPSQAINLLKTDEERIDKSQSVVVSDTVSQMAACARDFAPFPESGADARNRFIVNLAYEMGCGMDEVDVSAGEAGESKSCKHEISSMQNMTNADLNEKCSKTASFPDMCGGCLESKNLRGKDECGLLSQTERKNTIISELQRLDANTTTFPDAVEYQHMNPDALIHACASKTFTDWCGLLVSCGAPAVPSCATLSQQDKKNTFISLALLSTDGTEHQATEEALQSETDASLKSACSGMSMIQQNQVAFVEKKVAWMRKERLGALQDRRSRLEEALKSVQD